MRDHKFKLRNQKVKLWDDKVNPRPHKVTGG